MFKALQKLIDASQPTPPTAGDEAPQHRRDAYPVRVVLTIAIWISIIIIMLRGCAAIIP